MIKNKRKGDVLIEDCIINNKICRKGYKIWTAIINKEEVLHCEDGPAFLVFFKHGQVNYKEYYLNGVLHREDGPAKITYSKNGRVIFQTYFINGIAHRDSGPAFIYCDEFGKFKKEQYWLNGECVLESYYQNCKEGQKILNNYRAKEMYK